MTVNVGIIGFGYWGPNLVRNFAAVKDVHVTHIADLNEARLVAARESYGTTFITKNYKDLLQDPQVHAVIIATPVSTHFRLASEALQAGKHVLIEKPMTRTVDEARKLIALAKEKGKVLMVDHTFEYCKPVEKINEYIQHGELGEVFSISMSRLNLGLFQKDINVIGDLCPHDISFLLHLLKQMPISVNAVGMDHVQKGIEDDCHVFLKFGKNITASIHVSWLDPCKVRRVAIVGSKKMLLYDDVEPTDKIKLYDKGIVKSKDGLPVLQYYTTPEEFQLAYKYGDVVIPKIDMKEPLFAMASHFISCIRDGKKPLTDGVSGLRVVKILEAAQQSLKSNGAAVPIDGSFDDP